MKHKKKFISVTLFFTAASVALASAGALPGIAASGITLESSFASEFGANPSSALTDAGGGIYYGTAYSGGAFEDGAIFEFNSTTGLITLKASFKQVGTGATGGFPTASLTAAGSGVYYGTAEVGGTGLGTVFEFNSTTSLITLKNSFNGVNGSYPSAELIAAGNGLYYGTVSGGGANSLGGIFEFNSNTGSITLKASFTGANGANPYARLTAAGGGIYYGTTRYGGADQTVWQGGAIGLGSVFEFNSNTGAITLKDSFTGSNGSQPIAALIPGEGGLYYGTAYGGGASNQGGVFEFNSNTGAINLIKSFNILNGGQPTAELVAAGNGLYYGTTSYGGALPNGGLGKGVVFEFNSNTGSIAVKSIFTDANGSVPSSGLIASAGGLYYGVTFYGGANDAGAIYSFNPLNAGSPDPSPVPAPLPLMGAGAAFSWSRQLRRRMRQAQAVRRLIPVQI